MAKANDESTETQGPSSYPVPANTESSHMTSFVPSALPREAKETGGKGKQRKQGGKGSRGNKRERGKRPRRGRGRMRYFETRCKTGRAFATQASYYCTSLSPLVSNPNSADLVPNEAARFMLRRPRAKQCLENLSCRLRC